MKLDELKIGVVGLGYVGLPLAIEFGKKYPTIGFDIKEGRIGDLRKGHDYTLEVDDAEFAESQNISFTSTLSDLENCNFYIVTVPTPIDKHKRPDLTPLKKASESIGSLLRNGDYVVYESTVYPGATEEVCLPILEEQSGLSLNEHFFLGYSPERINPGDKTHRLTDILKVTSGSNDAAAEFIDSVYKSIITAGTYKAASLKVAEAAKVIENTQRDLNIALINELALIFDRLGIDTEQVLQAAGTKWNFLPFRPGLVGGHCIGVDPYYLTHKAQEVGYNPEIILAGRRINDGMGAYVVSRLIKELTRCGINPGKAKVLLLGLTFKENCPDLRNTKIVDVVTELQSYGTEVDIYDPWIDREEAKKEYDLDVLDTLEPQGYEAVIVAVAHDEFKELSVESLRKLCAKQHIIYDLKYIFPEKDVDLRL